MASRNLVAVAEPMKALTIKVGESFFDKYHQMLKDGKTCGVDIEVTVRSDLEYSILTRERQLAKKRAERNGHQEASQ